MMNEEIIREARKRFGLLFREMRKERGLTQSEVAEFCCVTFQTINKVENGAFPYSVDLFLKLSLILEFKIEIAEKDRGREDRFILKEGKNPHTYALTDTDNKIVCLFDEGKFNETQKFSILEDSIIPINRIATILREMSDWLLNNRPDLV